MAEPTTDPTPLNGYTTTDEFFGTATPPDADDAPAAETPADATAPEEPAADPATPTAAAPAADTPAADADTAPTDSDTPADQAAAPWESDDNPYKAKLAALEQRYKATRDWDTQINAELQQIRKQNEILQQKVDGTYDPATDDAAVGTPSPEEREATARFKGKVDASIAAAIRQHGQEQVDQLLLAPDSPWSRLESDPINRARVQQADSPADEAIQIIREVAFFEKYGRDPVGIVQKITDEATTTIRAEADAAAEAKWKARAQQSSDQVTGVRDARGGSEAGQDPSPGPTPLHQIFRAYS